MFPQNKTKDLIYLFIVLQKMLLPCGLPPEREDDWEPSNLESCFQESELPQGFSSGPNI